MQLGVWYGTCCPWASHGGLFVKSVLRLPELLLDSQHRRLIEAAHEFHLYCTWEGFPKSPIPLN